MGGDFAGGFAAYGLAAPPPQLVMPAWTMNGFAFRLLGTDEKQYIVEGTSDFSNWDFVDIVMTTNGFVDVTDQNGSSYEQRFYNAYEQ